MLVAATVVPVQKIRLGASFIKMARAELFGFGDCGVTWENLERMWLIINHLECDTLTVDEEQCLLSKLQDITC